MGDYVLSGELFEKVASKVDGMTEQFTEEERRALEAVFQLAGAALSELATDVDGFASFTTSSSDAPFADTVFSDAWFRASPSPSSGGTVLSSLSRGYKVGSLLDMFGF